MTRSLQHFGEDDEAASTLRDLGYSEEEIGRTAGDPAVAGMAAEDRLRLSLRALSADHSDQVQRRAAEASNTSFNPKVFDKQEPPSGNDDEAYARGRRDERYLKRKDPNYVAPAKEPRAKKPPTPAQQKAAIMRPAKRMNSLAKMAKGSKGRRR